jgi:hypothetical protein
MTIIWENYQQAKRDVRNDDSYVFSAFDQFQHLRNMAGPGNNPVQGFRT